MRWAVGHWLAVPHARRAVQHAQAAIPAYVLDENGRSRQISLSLRELTADERQIILDGCLINFYNNKG